VLILVGKLSKLSTTTVYCTPPKSVPFEVRFEFSDHSFRIDSVQKGKAELMKLPLWNPVPIWKDHVLYFISDRSVPLVQFSNKFLPLLRNLICVQVFAEFCALTLLSSRYNFGYAYPSKSCKDVWQTWETTNAFGFQCLLGFHFEDGQDFELPKSLPCVQNQISAARSTSKTHDSWIVDRMRACKNALEKLRESSTFLVFSF
jgi:hypothetical protein